MYDVGIQSACENLAIKLLNDHYTIWANTVPLPPCYCNGTNKPLAYQTARPDNTKDDFEICLGHDKAYKDLYDDIFVNSTHAQTHCMSHHFVWRKLGQIQNTVHLGPVIVDCRRDMIYHLEYSISSIGDTCQCSANPNLTTTSAPSSTTTHPPHNYKCNRLGILASIAIGNSVHKDDATDCSIWGSASDESLALLYCSGLPPSASWYRGNKVMDNCAQVQPWTPIATFRGTQYSPMDAQSGVFIECLKDSSGFLMVEQGCHAAPIIVRVSAADNKDPNSYYTIV
ncbi:uncharacterized protein LOC128221231 [Mya arenaria]|uniref:uncharacterized protein LOC128221231 n=1 Tax=Mya arenaria TaxID=6604 RepID=UPI0022E34B49|nr:uncharacterized protein LOC128221231 [Mya arenaria]